MRRLIIASMLVLATPGTASAASPSPLPSPGISPGPALPGELRINEFLPNPVGTDTGNEWIELANVSGRDLAVGGLVVARLSGSTLVTVPSGAVVKAGEMLLLNQLSGSIVNGGDTLVLKSGQTELDRATYDANGAEGSSWARLSAGEGGWTTIPTPGLANPVADPPTGPEDGAGGGSDGSGVASAAVTRASAASARASTKAAAAKPAAKKLSAAGAAGIPYLLAAGLAMLYWYARRSPV